MKRRAMIKAAAVCSAAPLLIRAARDNEFYKMSSVLPAGVKRFGDGRDWFFTKRFGMFIHWGLYAIPAWHEQYQWRARIPRAEYVKLAGKWNPVKFNPDQWLDLMEEAGMKYLTITTKHHDGFCLWDTKQTKFNTMNTPYGKDIIGIISEACHKRGVPLCFYYSIADWNHPSYPNQGRHHELSGPEPGDRPDWFEYMEFLKLQVRELCTNYGTLGGFWWDMNVPQYKDPSINEMIRKLQPDAVINNRGFDDGDFGTPERDTDAAASEAASFSSPVEACQSVGMESWGYRSDEDYYSEGHLIRSIDKYLARDANYLLNVGPMANGLIPEQSAKILRDIGNWYHSVKEAFEDITPASGLISGQDALVTRKGNIIYIHFHKGLTGNGFKLKPINVLPGRAVILNNGKEAECVVNLAPSDHLEQKPYLRLHNLPSDEMSDTALIVKLDFKNYLI